MLLNLNLIWFSFKYLMITEVFIRTPWGWGSGSHIPQRKELANTVLSGSTFQAKLFYPFRMFSAELPFLDEEGGPSLPVSKAQALIKNPQYHRLVGPGHHAAVSSLLHPWYSGEISGTHTLPAPTMYM